MVSYGNRLFCDSIDGELRHRWGSAKLYRAYYQDYRAFLSRPEVAAESISEAAGKRVYVVHADLRQFYGPRASGSAFRSHQPDPPRR